MNNQTKKLLTLENLNSNKVENNMEELNVRESSTIKGGWLDPETHQQQNQARPISEWLEERGIKLPIEWMEKTETMIHDLGDK